jgi:hypothetical protein
LRRFLVLAALMVVAAPLQAQKKKRPDPYKITAEELVEYGGASVGEAIQRLRPNFYIFTPAADAGINLPTVTGIQYGIVVFNGSQQLGDTSMLRYYRANDVKEVRYYKPGNALSPLTAGNSFVIQLVMKDRTNP